MEFESVLEEELVCEPNQSVMPEPNQSVMPEPNQSVMPPAELNQSLPHQPSLDLTEDRKSVEITEPTLVKSTLGNMQVLPGQLRGTATTRRGSRG